MIERRFTPVAVCVGLAVAVLLARLWDVQVVQHEIWAQESANLVRSASIEPATRGAILDRRGRPMVRDEQTYSLEFVWRDFRRGHPLGQVAMMRSAATMRPVGIDRARASLREAAIGYASLSPKEVDDFADGKALNARVDYVPRVFGRTPKEIAETARSERRAARARDLRFYIKSLFQLTRGESRRLRRLLDKVEGAKERSYLELVGEVTDQTTEDVARAVESRVLEADLQLSLLAAEIDWAAEGARDPDVGVPGDRALSPGDRLVALIEEQRQAVEDDAADALFRIALGFSAMRLGHGNLRALDLEWLRVALDWDLARMDRWRESRGRLFESEVLGWMAGHTIARAKIQARDGDDPLAPAADEAFPADRLLSAVAHALRTGSEEWTRRHATPEDWRRVDELEPLGRLAQRLEGGDAIARAASEPVLPFQSEALRTAGVSGAALLVQAFGPALARTPGPAGLVGRPLDVAEALLEVVEEGKGDWDKEDEVPITEVLLEAHRAIQGRVSELLASLAGAPEGEPAPPGSVRVADVFLEKAVEARAHVIRDRGARSKTVGGEPPMELVLLVSRYAGAFSGFRVTSSTKRVPLALSFDGATPLASQLIGTVRSPFLVDVLRQRPSMERLALMGRKLRLAEEDRQPILRLVDRIYRAGEVIGGFGIESWMNAELSGRDGFLESYGLQDQVEGNRSPIYRGARRGQDVTLTLDIDVQRAAEDVLAHPRLPKRYDSEFDRDWFEAPVGAIVLARTTGEILAAASVPIRPGHEVKPYTNGQRAFAYERTLGRPVGQPPGSVVKPILAAYALEHLDLSAAQGLVLCDVDAPRLGAEPKRSSRPGWGRVNCSARYGHSGKVAGRMIDLNEALKRSCNVYFAALGELEYDGEDIRAAYDLFGFGRPTGVRFDDSGERSALNDAFWYDGDSSLREDGNRSPNPVERQFLGNGLQEIDANVVQVARAYAGLATGELPEMRLIAAVGGVRVPTRTVPLGISDINMQFVREALEDVVHAPGGTANNKGLGEDDLTFRLAAKTGTADFRQVKVKVTDDDDNVRTMLDTRNHTWLAGWFPAAAPEFVVVVHCHDTSTTAGRSAVFVAEQFLKRPEVAALLNDATEEVPR